jgi:hypothetical protein
MTKELITGPVGRIYHLLQETPYLSSRALHNQERESMRKKNLDLTKKIKME